MQEANGYCSWPKKVCFTECNLDGKDLDCKNAHKLAWPERRGELVLSFVDLTPVPCNARPMARARFLALRSIVLNNRVRLLSTLLLTLFHPTLEKIPSSTLPRPAISVDREGHDL